MRRERERVQASEERGGDGDGTADEGGAARGDDEPYTEMSLSLLVAGQPLSAL